MAENGCSAVARTTYQAPAAPRTTYRVVPSRTARTIPYGTTYAGTVPPPPPPPSLAPTRSYARTPARTVTTVRRSAPAPVRRATPAPKPVRRITSAKWRPAPSRTCAPKPRSSSTWPKLLGGGCSGGT